MLCLEITSTTTLLDPLACLVFEVTLYQSTSRMMTLFTLYVDELAHSLSMSAARAKETRSVVNVTDILKLKMN